MPHPTHQLLGDAPAIADLRERIRHLASFDRPGSPHVPTVLVLGETGTGKGLVARLLHDSGARAGGPYVDVNCAAIPDTMLEAELFGFEAGAFTDARRPKPGLFEAAAGGTLFLDEIDALPLALQGKLLKAIEEKRVRRLGAVADRAVDVRLVAATQRDLREMMAERTFRADLFHRLAVVVLDLPPLRDRADDVLALAEHYLRQHAVAHGIEPRRLGDDARAWLRAQSWPGNVRELAHLIERLTLLCTEVVVTPAHLEGLRLSIDPRSAPPPLVAPPVATGDEAARIGAALARAGGNVVRAAKLLGIGRNALRGRMRRLGIERPALDQLDEAPPPAPLRPSPPRAGEPSWEQKAVVVLALDLDSPASAPEPWTIAHRWQRTLTERVAGFGGVFVSRTPTRATIVFGVPRAIDQLPLRAVQAAFALQRSVADGPAELRPGLRCALHAGFVRVDVGAVESAETLLALGDTLALPERLLGHAGAGEILASSAFGRRVQSACTLRPRTLRIGESDALDAVVVTRREPHGPEVDAAFVGRARELEQLRGAFAAAADGRGELALLVGEPGIGKSRLLAEFRRSLRDVEHHWVEGRCASYAATTALYAITDAVRTFCGIDDRDDAAVVGDKLAATVRAATDDLEWAIPFLRAALALDPADAAVAAMDSASRRSETFRAFKAMLQRLSAQRPLVIVIEDLHWIDPASEECLAFLADAVSSSRTLMICTYRPGYKQPFGDHTFHVRIPLRALAAGDVARMSGALLGDAVPEELQALIAAKAEGNPFFVEEVTRHLLDGGAVRQENGQVTLACDPATIAVPDTIHEVLAARIDRLADDARRAIQVAAVIGREFALRLLARITEAGDRIRTQVDELRSLELIYEKAADPELAFMFKHALTHDVAYASVMSDRRRALHRTIGLAIEELYADRLTELVETLAHHFERAEEWTKALDYHERAVAKAAEHFANRAVIAHCRSALAIVERFAGDDLRARRRQLEERLALASFYVSDFGDAGEAFERAAALAPTPAEQGLDLGHAALGYGWAHRYDDAGRTAGAAVDVGRLVVAPPAQAFGLSLAGFLAVVCRGDVDENERLQHEAFALLREPPSDEVARAMVQFHLALGLEWTGDYRRSIALSEEVIAAGRRLRLAHLVVWPAWFLGKAYCCLGDYRTALARLGEATAVCDRIGDRAWKSRLLNTLGWCHAEIGDVDGARLHNERAAASAREIRDPEIIANSEINLAGNWLARGDLDRAQSYLDPLQESLRRDGDPWMRWRWSLHLTDAAGRIALARGRADGALRAAEEQLAGARRHRVPKVEGRALGLRAEALLALDRRDDAREAATAALAVAERIGYPRTVWQSLGLLAEVDRRDGRTSAAAETTARRDALLARLAAGLEDAGLRAALRVGR